MGVTGGEGCPCRGLVNMEEVLRILSPLNPLSPQGVDARGRAAGEPGLGGARVEGRESGGPEAPADGAALRFVARASHFFCEVLQVRIFIGEYLMLLECT